MKPITIASIALAFAALSSTGTLAAEPAAHGYVGAELASGAKIDIAHARAIALKARPGAITAEELEKEAGGSGLRYAFDIVHLKKTYEVGVDAVTGKVLENAVETAAQERAEAKADAKAKKPN